MSACAALRTAPEDDVATHPRPRPRGVLAAPLLVLGVPVLPMLWALPRSSRVAVGTWWIRRTYLRTILHTILHPGSVFVLHMVAIWFWHLPVPYQAALRDPATHALEHLSFFGTALLFWWCIAAPIGRPCAHDGADLLLVGGTLMQSGVLGAALVFSRSPWYPVHAAGARAWGTTLLDDQQLAGLLMWIPASVVYLGAAVWLFLRWFQSSERAVAAADRLHLARTLQPRPQEVV